jgi:hypothetical protein
MINIGSRREAVTVGYHGAASRSPARSSILRSNEKFFPYAGSGDSRGSQVGQDDTSDTAGWTHRAHDDDAKRTSGKGEKGKKD